MITKLNEDQMKGMAIIREKWEELMFCTEPSNRQEAEDGLRQAYREGGLSEPQRFVWVNDLHEGVKFIRDTFIELGGTDAEIENSVLGIFGPDSFSWLAYFDFFINYMPEVKGPEKLKGMIKVANNVRFVWMLENVCVCVERKTDATPVVH